MISSKVIADSVFNGNRITSLQLVMPRFILAQFNTHRCFSRSTASSRAIPTAKLIEQVRNDYVRPIRWGKNQAGMVAEQDLHPKKQELAKELWWRAAQNAADSAEQLAAIGVHKQVVNRVLEPFMWAHTIVTSTEWDNFFKLRLADDAQPEIQMLAEAMLEAIDTSIPKNTRFHLPYIREAEIYEWQESLGVTTKETLFDAYLHFAPISAARCARVSYLNHDQTDPVIEKDMQLAERLLEAHHFSPFEHQAYAFDGRNNKTCLSERNFKNWKQYRTTIEDKA